MQTETIAIVKATVPAIEASGEAITQHFYGLLFTENPELQHVFNMASQANGRQQSTLAAAILGYAANIDNLGALGGAVEKIAMKHFSLDITPPQYEIVGRNLLKAIRAVLGEEVATDAVLQAWSEAYQQLADILIGREQQLYAQAEAEGWAGFKAFSVNRIVDESDEIRSIYLSPVDGKTLPEFLPGQFISVKIVNPDWEHEEIRQYSLSDRHTAEGYRISVKREPSPAADIPEGRVSNYLHTQIRVGSRLAIHMPGGDLVLQQNKRPVVLISGGVGITPMLSMLNEMLFSRDSRKIVWLHGTRNRRSHAFAEHIGCLKRDYPQLTASTFYDELSGGAREDIDYDHQGYITADWLEHYCPENAEYYFCGPLPFMKAIYQHLKNRDIEDERLHYEVFGPGESLA
ncbi:MAG: NO-inducible flavohemoprotein [Oceanospirillales bacterium]|nr:NO-inducible flavohemoprotein [Oceanospirillales bacterium]MBR9888385.1 NO-inducible flavohemoprotein [Oceanospirillales bacterium]